MITGAMPGSMLRNDPWWCPGDHVGPGVQSDLAACKAELEANSDSIFFTDLAIEIPPMYLNLCPIFIVSVMHICILEVYGEAKDYS